MSGRLMSALFLLAIVTLAGCQNPGRFQGPRSHVSSINQDRFETSTQGGGEIADIQQRHFSVEKVHPTLLA